MQRTFSALAVTGAMTLVAAAPAAAVNTVTTANGANWQIHDAAPPILDTGSIRAISDNAFYDYAGILYYWAKGWLRATPEEAGP